MVNVSGLKVSENMTNSTSIEKLETFVLVTVIAVLVWLYAEDRTAKDYKETIKVEFVAPAGEDLAIDPHEPPPIEISFRASKAYYQAFEKLQAQGALKLKVASPQPGDSIIQPVILDELLRESQLGVIGITGVKATPATMELNVEPIVSVEMPIEVDAGNTKLDDEPVLEPATATLTIKRSLVERAQVSAVIAELTGDVLRGLPDGHTYTKTAKLKLPPDLAVRWSSIAPQTAEVTFTIRNRTIPWEVTAVPIRLDILPLLLSQYDIQLQDGEQLVPTVELLGPNDVINAIKADKSMVGAMIHLDPKVLEAALESDTYKALVEITVPAGVTVVAPIAHSVTIIVTAKEAELPIQ
jgi:hypothetical protein